MYHCRSIVIDERGNPLSLTGSRPEYENVFDLIYERIKMNRTQFVGDFLYRTSSLKRRKGFYKLPVAWGSDDITAYINSSSLGIAHTNNPIFMYRDSEITLTSNGFYDLKIEALNGEMAWLTSFADSIPAEGTHFILKKNINEYLDTYFHRRLNQTLMAELYSKKMLNAPYYFLRMKYYKYSIYDLLKVSIRCSIRLFRDFKRNG